MDFLKKILMFFLPWCLLSCADDVKDIQLDFIGDSIVARWDLAESFPSYRTKNYGVSGSGIEYLESMSSRFNGRTVVILSGTNNNYLMTEADRTAYMRRYVDAILALGADKVYLYSVLPRDFSHDRTDINEDIFKFDSIVEEAVADFSDIVYLNIYRLFLKDGKINPQLYSDGLHLSTYGYEILTRFLLDRL